MLTWTLQKRKISGNKVKSLGQKICQILTLHSSPWLGLCPKVVDDVGGTVGNVVGPSIVVVDVKEPHSETKKKKYWIYIRLCFIKIKFTEMGNDPQYSVSHVYK